MTFPSSLDVFVFSLLWTGVLLSISHRKYNIPPSIVQEPQLANCRAIDCEQGDKVTIYFKEDEPIEISCVASGRPNVTYKWTKDYEDFEVGSDSRIKILPNSGTLFISNASQTDHGLYQCFATNSLGTSLSKKATVIFAINEVFKSVIRPEEIQANEGLPISLKCNVPYVVPKPSVYWTNVGRFDVDPLASRVSLSERIVLDYEGTLHFAHIRATDIKQNGKFTCNMHNNIYRTYSEGEDKKVKVIKSKMTSPVKLLWKSNQIVEGLKGGEATFMCVFGGNPTPAISWKRKDKPMNDRMRISATGHELIITELDISDSGYYECSGLNDLTTQPVIVTFELTVEALPYFVKAPSDVTIGVQEDAEFPCMVEGIPKPDVQWLVNGIPIEDTPPNPRRIVQKNRIVFRNVSKDDSQVLQCTATNKHGSTMMDVYLNVLALKPEITSGPGSKKVAEGKSVTLSCEHNGKPTPKLSWKKSTQILTGDTYTFSHNSIFIKNATLNDDGPYTCMATNMFGTAVEDGSLTVRKKTTVSVHPVERLLRNGEGATFACIALTDPAEKPNLVITWYKNGEELKANQEEGIRIVGDSLQIRKTRSKDSGNYTCHADNGIDNASAVSQLKVEAKPEVPKSLLLKTCGNLKAGLIWQPGFDNYLKITSFHIYGKSTYDKDYILMKDLTGNYTQWELDVTPYANYTFKITAKNLLGESLMSDPTNVCTTKEFPPSHHPKNVKIIDNKTGKLVIEWDAIKPKEQNGPGFKYIIYTTHLKSGKKKSYEVTDWDTTKKEIDVDNTYEQYKVEVKAQNVKGDATDKSYIYRGHSGMGVPTEVPGNFEVDPDEPFNHEAISFRWDPVDTSDTAMKGKFAGYRVVEAFRYKPPIPSWKNELLTSLEIPFQIPNEVLQIEEDLPLTDPTAVHPILGDGNCLFRALSYSLTDTEEFHQSIRFAICDFMSKNPNKIRFILPNNCDGDVDHYLLTSSMALNAVWGTEVELFTASILFNVNIFVFSQSGIHWKWIKYSPPDSVLDRGIYLYHKGGNHFEVVLAVVNSKIPTHLNKHQYYNPFQQKLEEYKIGQHDSARKCMRKRYKTDADFARKQKIKSKTSKQKRLTTMKNKYSNDLLHKEKKKRDAKEKYKTNSTYRKKKMVSSILKYCQNSLFRRKVIQYSKLKYRNNLVFRTSSKQQSKQKYATDADFRSQVKSSSKKKYATDSNFRDQVKTASKQKYAKNAVFRSKLKEKSRFKYRRFSAFRNSVKASSIRKYASSPLFRHALKTYLRKKYSENTSIQQKKKARVTKSRKEVRYAIRTFKRNIQENPRYICKICIRLLYKKQVKRFQQKRYMDKGTGKLNKTTDKCILATNSHDCDEHCNSRCWHLLLKNGDDWICHTCDRYLQKNKLPPQSLANNLYLPTVPPTLEKLNVLERQLVALRIPFMKLLSLPRGGQKGVKGPVVNVPSDITSVSTALPRNINDAQLIKVKLKRKISYKGYYSYKWINPAHVLEAIKYLKNHNKWYEDVVIHNSWEEQNEDKDFVDPENKWESDENEEVDIPKDGNDQQMEEEVSEEQTNGVSEGLPVESCLQPIDIGQEILDANKTLCIAPGENNTPQNMFTEEGSEAMAFPTLLPDGQFGLFQDREIKLSPSKYFNCRLLSADQRFASNKEYIFFAQYLTEINRISSNISLALRKGKQTTDDGTLLTASMLINSDHVQDILKSDVGFRFLQPIRGTPPYWQRTMKELFAMIHQLGIPTWFVTFSSGETRWPEVLKMLLFLNNDNTKPEDLEWLDKCSLIADNPLPCARMFDHRVKSLFTDLIMSPSCPLGKVQDYFYRTEFQQRGSPHIHCILWIKDAPRIGQSSDDEVCNFIDRYVTCKMPDKEKDPELYEIISSVQVHNKNHSKSCRKYSSTCRFNFPRPPIKKTFIAKPEVDKSETNSKPPETVEELNKVTKAASRTSKQILKDIWSLVNSAEDTGLSMHGILKLANVSYQQFQQSLVDIAKKNTVHIKRNLADIWVNNYNPDLSRAWNANLDIQYVTDAYACVAYILSYISKAEAEMGDLLQNAQKEAIDGNLEASSALKKIGSAYMQNREVSAQEAIYRVCGLHLKKCTREVTFIPAGKNIFRMSLPMTVIKSRCKEDKDNNDIWMTSIHEKYYCRPDHPDFDNLCLAEFASKYSILPKSQKPKSTETQPVFELSNNLGSIRKRKPGKEAVIQYPKFKQDKQTDEYFLSLAQVFFPHRAGLTVPPDCASFEDYIINGSFNGQRIIDVINNNRTKFEQNTAELERAWEDVEEGRISEDSWGSLAPEAEVERLETQMEMQSDDIDELEDLPELRHDGRETSNPSGFHYEPPKVSNVEIQNDLRSMNKTQQDVFYRIRNWSLCVTRNENPDPFFLFLTGGAGTGKSHLVRCIYHEANRILSKSADSPDAVSVLLMAPTGTAAFNIQGMTIHSGLAINKKATLPYQPLGENLINTLRSKFQSLKILIIDEVSMVDQKILTYIHGRLAQIMHCKKPFGNVSILAVGDFYQLPPVKGLPLYKKRPSDFVDLWNENFSIVTLQEVMRQKDDRFFADMLNRLRVHIKGQPLLNEDLEALTLASRRETPVEAQSALHIYPTNKDVNDHNCKMVESACTSTVKSIAVDFYTDIVTGHMIQKDHPYATCAAEDLQTELHIGIGARVMLTRNIDTEDGLVNGAFGTIKGIDINPSKQVTSVYVKFDNPSVGKKALGKQTTQQASLQNSVRIKPYLDVLTGKRAKRKQLPLKLAWAATIHKVQGMTVDEIVVSLKSIFQPGMAYVAFSRATTLSGLHILNFNADAIYCSDQITEALKSMPLFLTEEQPSADGFHLILHNTQGMIPHIQDIKANSAFKNSDVICFTETWLDHGVNQDSLFPNYKFYSTNRADAYHDDHRLAAAQRGGVAMFVNSRHLHRPVQLVTPNLEVVATLINNVLFVTLYRPPSYGVTLFLQQMTSLLQEIQSLSILSVVCGDFNIDVFKHKENSFVQLFTDFGYKQLVTFKTTEGGTCLDLVFVRGLDHNCTTSISHTYYSYHDAVKVSWK